MQMYGKFEGFPLNGTLFGLVGNIMIPSQWREDEG